MSDFKSEYKQAVDRLEPDGRLLEVLKADMKAAAEAPRGNFPAPPKPNFFVRYRWVFGSAAACLAVVLAVGVFLTLGGYRISESALYNGGAQQADMASDKELSGDAPFDRDDNAGDADGAEPGADEAGRETYEISISTTSPNIEMSEDNTAVTTVTQTEGEAVSTDTQNAGKDDIAPGDVEDGRAELPPMLGAEAERLGRLRPLTYEELKGLVTTVNERGLSISDFVLYDYIEGVSTEGFYLVLRYDNNDVSCPVVAVFPDSADPSATLKSLKLFVNYDDSDRYVNYDDSGRYIELLRMSVEELEDYIT